MNEETPRQLTFRLDTMVLVCKACGKRSSGPQDAKPKQLAKALKETAKDMGKAPKRKLRIVMTSCLGLCPKRATAVLVAEKQGPPRQFAVERLDQAADVLGLGTPS